MMTADEHGISDPDDDDDWGARRAHLRHAVAIDAVALDPRCGEIACLVEDLSASGMALRTELSAPVPGKEPLKPGVEIKLRFAPAPGAEEITVAGRVMWRRPTAFGLRFSQIDETLTAALRAVARSAVEARLGGTASVRREMTAAQRSMIRDCRRTLLKLVPNLVWSLRSELASQLRLAAQGAGNDEAAVLISNADTVDEQATNIARTIEHEFLQGFAEATGTDETQEMSLAIVAAAAASKEQAALEITADRDARDAAIVAVLGNGARERFKVQFFELDVRLANVVGHVLDSQVNSIAPEVACSILWSGITRFADSPNVRRYLRKAMQQRAIPLLGELYAALHEALDEAGAETYFDRDA